MKTKIININFVAFVLVSFYSIGAGCVESLVNYPIWHILGPGEEWTDYHRALGSRIIATLAIPALLLQLITNIMVIIRKPPEIPRWTGWFTLSIVVISIVSSAFVQIPIQLQLDEGYSEVLVDKLIRTDLTWRIGPGVIRVGVILYMLYVMIVGKVGKVAAYAQR